MHAFVELNLIKLNKVYFWVGVCKIVAGFLLLWQVFYCFAVD